MRPAYEVAGHTLERATELAETQYARYTDTLVSAIEEAANKGLFHTTVRLSASADIISTIAAVLRNYGYHVTADKLSYQTDDIFVISIYWEAIGAQL